MERASSATEIRKIFRQINYMDLDKTDFEYIVELISKVIKQVPFSGFNQRNDTRFYRGVIHKNKPGNTSLFTYPPAEKVIDFQRCNPPGAPMFYCSAGLAPIFYELDVKEGDYVYASKWSIKSNFYLNQIVEKRGYDTNNHPTKNMISTFFETKFSEPIHETFSTRYKVTAAIAKKMGYGKVENQDIKIGGIVYPSVSYPGTADNMAIFPEIVDECLQLDYVEEIEVMEVSGNEFKIEYRDFSSNFENNIINWAGRHKYWNVKPGQLVTATAEPDGWIIRDEKANIINPG